MSKWTRTLIIASLAACSLTGCDGEVIRTCMNCFKHDAQKPLSDAQASGLKIIGSVKTLPTQARNVYFQESCGIDCAQMIRFDLPADTVHAVMKPYATVAIRPLSADDQRTLLRAPSDGAPLNWWLKEAIPNAEGVANDLQSGHSTAFIFVPNGKDMRIYMRAFTM